MMALVRGGGLALQSRSWQQSSSWLASSRLFEANETTTGKSEDVTLGILDDQHCEPSGIGLWRLG